MPNYAPNAITPHPKLTELPPLAMDKKTLDEDFLRYYNRTLGRDKQHCTDHYLYEALAYTVRDRLMERWKETRFAYEEKDARRTCYLSLEFLMGRALSNAMLNLGVTDAVIEMLYDYGIELEEVEAAEHDAGLGNGGLGRLAACFLDSCATLQLPVLGYGLRYEYGMFRQEVVNGYQIEEPDHWLRDGNPWEFERPEYTLRVQLGGRTEFYRDENGDLRVRWVDTHDVLAVPYDIPVPGYRNNTVNSLRLWKSTATDEFDLDEFNAGDYSEAVAAKNNAEHITMVLYPNDASENGKELRLRQQYFLASASLKDVLRRWKRLHGRNFEGLAEKHCFQLNDTHPSIAVAELMRLLVDDHRVGWDLAWAMVSRSMAYTNHTLLPEALEKWPVQMFKTLLPRLLEIIYEINARFLAEVSLRWPGDTDRLRRMSIIEEGDTPMVRMAYLAIVGSFSVNGVAELHSRLLKEGLFHDFFELWPHKFNNKTNGVTQRRWLTMCNPGLSGLISEHIGDNWTTQLDQLRKLAPYADDAAFRQRWHDVKLANKQRLADLVARECGVTFDTSGLFDVQVKRIHEYKRQLLNILHVIYLWLKLKEENDFQMQPRTFFFGGKAAPAYHTAKMIIQLICHTADMINRDTSTNRILKVVFIPNYRVSTAEIIYPGTDVSEQISTAGYEASGTSNMKFALNGALTVGTLDGANIEIMEEVGPENIFIFGLTTEEVATKRPSYRPYDYYQNIPGVKQAIDLIRGGFFCPDDRELFQPLMDLLMNDDRYLVLADFEAYHRTQMEIDALYRDPEAWTRKSILNVARIGKFSSDRTIQEYNRDIWNAEAVPIEKKENDK
jgi:starch phosphorylase